MLRPLAETMPAVTVLFKAERTADGEDPVADVHAVGVAQLGGGQRLLGVNLDDGQIGFPVHTDHGRVVGHGGGIVHQLHANAVGFLHHVVVGDDVALGIDDDAGAQRALTHVAHASPSGPPWPPP